MRRTEVREGAAVPVGLLQFLGHQAQEYGTALEHGRKVAEGGEQFGLRCLRVDRPDEEGGAQSGQRGVRSQLPGQGRAQTAAQ